MLRPRTQHKGAVYVLTQTLAHLLTHSLTYSLTHLLTHSLTHSSHRSRFINHAELPNLVLFGDDERLVVDFVATKDIAEGEELAFDYGVNYWLYRTPPEGDSRNFSDPRYRQRPPELALLYPPPVGTVFPLTPLTPLELQASPNPNP